MNALQWFQFLLSYLLQATLVIALAWLLEHRTQAAVTKTRIWTGCFVSLLGLLVAGILLPHIEWVHPWSRLGPSELLSAANAEFLVGRGLLAIWLLGCCVMLARWGLRFLDLQRVIRSCPKLSPADTHRLSGMVKSERLRPGGMPVVFRLCPEEFGPFCYQFHQPIIFLPHSSLVGDPIELRHVLDHELTHLETRHPMQLFAQQLVQVVLWFHPLVGVSGRRASLVREFVCDDAASDGGASTASYLRTLLHIVEHRTKPEGSVMPIGRSPSELKHRAKRLVSSAPHPVPRWGVAPVASLFVVAALASQVWLPTNPLASPTSLTSPWPSWSAAALHAFDVNVRDFERFDARLQVHELLEDAEWRHADGR
jgi:beta-lactamase regulating signal transducer with metallopeptidase domain